MKSWKGSYLLLYGVSHFTHICIHSAVLSQTRLPSPGCVSGAPIRDRSCRRVPAEPGYPHIQLLLAGHAPHYLAVVLCAGSPLPLVVSMKT